MKKISVLLSLFRNENPLHLQQCLESLTLQTRQPDQVVIVFDGPIGKCLEDIVNDFCDSLPLHIIRLPDNVGLASALNSGLDKCIGELIARFDTDDICYSHRLEVQERIINDSQVDILGSAATIINLNGDIVGIRRNPIQHEEIVANLWKNPFIHPSIMFRKESIQKVGGYNGFLRRRQDYDLWFRAAKRNLKLANLKEPLIYYRFDSHTLSKQSPSLAWMQGKIGFNGSMSCGLGIIKSMYCFIPFVRSLFPLWFQVRITQAMKLFDSRNKFH
ncbi:glycosyltransferase [Vibrio vulnificus]|uniref:glycosyltransferase n=1 Tax=Vibrio vulnificus TaxID=672 RepID=UPI00165D7022|nr:glycosyltransferase [Vibrio vulnificus]EGR9009288.1 glycosyltransferase [Vibrio vulnificus]EHU9457424.1 glycosyltransferase [Vibrio vulnificus]HAS6191812.1 glycosyltransferase [Vibrio vulnificus]HAS8258986.1 glycosyltransferase [Vibrio vulnificus]